MFNAAIGATTGCTLWLLLDSIPDEEKGLKYGICGDAWFGSIRAAAEISRHGNEAGFQIKQNHSLYPKAFIEETLKEAPGGVNIVLEGKTQCEVPLIVVRYRHSGKTILFFLLTKGVGSTIDGNPYEMQFTDSYENIVTHFVDHTDVISPFFKTSNAINTHNQFHQDLLQLEKR